MTRCSVAARARHDPLTGTALPTDRFLLVEDPGPWGPEPHPVGRLNPGVADHVHEQARQMAARLLLVRRFDRHPDPDGPRRWARVDTTRRTVFGGLVRTPDELASVDLARDGEEDPRPWYLVCTQGRHDLCCAVYGRPVAQALSALDPERTWECSHVGGDRFAANVVLMPAALVYGNVETSDVGELVDAYAAGAVVPRLLRGRCGLVPAAQVAEHHARELLGDRGIDAFVPVAVTHEAHDRWQVDLRHRGGQVVRVVVVERHDEVSVGLTCAAAGPGRRRDWDVLAVDVVAGVS